MHSFGVRQKLQNNKHIAKKVRKGTKVEGISLMWLVPCGVLKSPVDVTLDANSLKRICSCPSASPTSA
jgi:hypothetical protein